MVINWATGWVCSSASDSSYTPRCSGANRMASSSKSTSSGELGRSEGSYGPFWAFRERITKKKIAPATTATSPMHKAPNKSQFGPAVSSSGSTTSGATSSSGTASTAPAPTTPTKLLICASERKPGLLRTSARVASAVSPSSDQAFKAIEASPSKVDM